MRVNNFREVNSRSIGGDDVFLKMSCCGCSACLQKCPKKCIEMHEDAEGFLYPEINDDFCIDCGICYNVCPVRNQKPNCKPLAFYASQSKDETLRLQSSSGGIFSLLAEYIIRKGGIVFGARFNEKMELVHEYTETINGLAPFRGSKYVQSKIGDSFKQVEYFLKQGRMVLFSWVPCQIAALKLYLQKEYDNLLTVDVICHGVPSPGVFREYIKYLGKGNKIININFRDKHTGWTGYSTSYTLSNGKHKHFRTFFDYFLGAGLRLHYFLRPSCFRCPAKSGKSGSDLTLGDLWHIKYVPEIHNDDKGASLLAVHTLKGKDILRFLDVNVMIPQNEDNVRMYNASFYVSPDIPKDRELFWQEYALYGFIAVKQYCKKLRPTRLQNRWIVCKIELKKYLTKYILNLK